MKCSYCDSEFSVDSLKNQEKYGQDIKKFESQTEAPESIETDDFSVEQTSADEITGMISYSCTSCGGEIVGDENLAATSCPYCGNTAIITSRLDGFLQPDLIIPFKLDKEAAKESLKNFYKGKILMPSLFATENKIDSIMGVYVPFWLFDCDARGDVEYKATQVHMWSDHDYNYTKSDYYHVYRAGDASFVRMPVDGSTKMNDDYMEAIEPYDYNELAPFKTPYLAGFGADKYDVDAEQSKPRAQQRIQNSVADLLSGTVTGYDSVTPVRQHFSLSHGLVKYAFLPVWMLGTIYKNVTYTFAMNAQTGKFVGSLPTAWAKLWAWFFGLFLGTGTIGSLIIYLLTSTR
jgi:predicted RNA-binding Zn-ribbon protein involved in translation (DUF1610 family)